MKSIDYENIGQTQKQFIYLYGENKEKWSGAAKASHDILFEKSWRGVAAKRYGITRQTVQAFLVRNREKHLSMLTLRAEQEMYEGLVD